MRRRTRNRRGAGLVEFAIVAPVLFMMLMGTVIGAVGVFQYQQVAQLAREGSRWASVHGAGYAAFKGTTTLTTASNVYTNAIQPYAVGLNRTNVNNGHVALLSYSVTWADPTQSSNIVTVVVTYQWLSLKYFGSPTFSSTSKAVMSN